MKIIMKRVNIKLWDILGCFHYILTPLVPVEFQRNQPETVGGVAYTRYLLLLKEGRKKPNTIYEPRHEISNNVVCATNKVSDQPAHMRSLIRAFASRMNILLL